MPLGNFVLTCFVKRLPINATFWNKDKIASLSSFSHSIPVGEKTTGKGGGKNLFFIIFSYDNWNGEQQAVSVHLTTCKRYCDSQTLLAFHSSDYVIVISYSSSPTNSATTGWLLIISLDQSLAKISPACSKFLSSSSSSTVLLLLSKWVPAWLCGTPLNSLLKLDILLSIRLKALCPGAFVTTKYRSCSLK